MALFISQPRCVAGVTATRLPFFRMGWKMFKDASLTRERDLSREGTNYRILKGCCQHAAAAVFVVRGWDGSLKRAKFARHPIFKWCLIRDALILTDARRLDFFLFFFL